MSSYRRSLALRLPSSSRPSRSSTTSSLVCVTAAQSLALCDSHPSSFSSFTLVGESQVFYTDFSVESPSTFARLFAPSLAKNRKQELTRIGRQVATFCATLGEYPIVRYSVSSMNTPEGPMSKVVASSIQEQIDHLYRLNPDAVVRVLYWC